MKTKKVKRPRRDNVFSVRVTFDGELEIKIKASSQKDADKVANDLAYNLALDNRIYDTLKDRLASADVTNFIKAEVLDCYLEEEK